MAKTHRLAACSVTRAKSARISKFRNSETRNLAVSRATKAYNLPI